MVIEIVAATAVSFLWGKLADKAEAKDNEIAIKKALHNSILQSFQQFHEKYDNSSESFFNQEFLENHACPEILKYLTRNQKPDLDAINQALPVNAIFSSNSGFRDELKDFFEMIFECMKSHAVLQEIINHRQTEETNQIVKDIHEGQKSHSKILNDGFDSIAFQQEEATKADKQILLQNAENKQKLDQILSLMNDNNLPSSKGNELNKFLVKQLDKARDFIKLGKVNDAKSLLDTMEDEVSESDDYTRFRWHTNLGACLLLNDNIHEAAEQYLTAYNFAKDEEKAVSNRIRAFLLLGHFDDAKKESDKAIQEFRESGIIWAIHINSKILSNIKFDKSLLPGDLQHDISVLLSLSDMNLREKEYEQSYALANDALQQDEKSIDAKRAILASAISWAAEDTVKSYYKQLSTQQQHALKRAIDSFGDIIPFLTGIQGKLLFTEFAHNLAVATELLGEYQLKKEITSYAFSIYPDDEAFIWYRVKSLKESGDIDAIHKLTDDKITSLEKPLLFTIAEIGSNTGDTQWVETISHVLSSRELDKRDNDELFGLKLCSIWKGGDKTSAIKLAKDNLFRITSYPSLLSFYIRMLDEQGEINERNKLLQSCTTLSHEASSIDIIQIADLLYDFNFYYDASALYQKLIVSPSDDYLTKRYLDSLIKSDQRAKAFTELDRLPEEIRNLSSFKRIEANLARASGDLATLERILKEELDADPSDSYAAVGYIATLYRRNQLESLTEYLSTIPSFVPVIEQNEIEIAKYQMELGMENQALLRMYSLFRKKPNNSEIAGHFLLLMLLVKQIDQLKSLNEVSACTIMYLESDGESKNIIIEPDSLEDGYGWPECISESSELANNIIGKKVGNVVQIDSGMGSKPWNITGVDSMFIYASNIAQIVVASSASSSGPLWSVNVKKSNGEFDFTPILDSLKQRKKRVEDVFNVYEEKKPPLQILSKALGTDIVTLLLEWPYNKYDLFISTGIHEDREKIKTEIASGNKPYVVDLTCLTELHALGFLQESIDILGKPLVAASLREQLLSIIQIHRKMEPSGIATEIDGQLNFQEIPQRFLEERERFLNELLAFIDKHCEVVPVIGPETVTQQQADLEQYIGLAPNDTILLTRERDATLVSEDGGFRSLASGMGVKSSTWLQPILMTLRDRGAITEAQYSKCILDKLKRRHTFTSVTANDLLWPAKADPNVISPDVEYVIQTFKNPTLDLVSGVVVGGEFLGAATCVVQPKVLYQYYKLLMEALSFDREISISVIHEAFSRYIYEALPHVKPKTAKLIIRKFGNKLTTPKPIRLYLNPVSNAVKDILR